LKTVKVGQLSKEHRKALMTVAILSADNHPVKAVMD